jgi:hypothetical protein
MFLTFPHINRLWVLMAFGVRGAVLIASTAQAEVLKINSTFEGGIDAWAITPSQPDPSSPRQNDGSVVEDHNALALPDSDTKWNYRPVSPWMRFTSNVRLNPNLEANIKVRVDQLMGAHVDVANLDWSPSPYLGFRAGVVNFNTNWCRTYDVDSPWMVDPDIFCRGNSFVKINNAAPGLQAYTNTTLGDYQLQTIVGVYRPQFFSYETKEFGFNNGSLGAGFKINFNRKISAAANLLHLQTGTQLRLGVMRSDEGGVYDPKPVKESRARRNLVDNYYVGIDTYLRPTLRLRYSRSKFASQDFYDDLLTVRDKDKSETLELIYEWKSTDLLAMGWTQFNVAAAVNDVGLNPPAVLDDFYYLKQSSWLTSWRHQWGRGMYSILQWTQASQTNGYFGGRRSGSGGALGLRLAYQY